MKYKSSKNQGKTSGFNTMCVRSPTNHGLQYTMPAELVFNSAGTFTSSERGSQMMADREGHNFSYQRYGNPNTNQLEKKLSGLENCRYSIAVNSGMTAVSLIMRALVESGQSVATFSPIFYESCSLIQDECKHKHAELHFLNYKDTDFYDVINKCKPCLIFAEFPFNPTLADIDMHKLCNVCAEKNIILVADISVLTPLCINPLQAGATLSVYSLTKHINGHGDISGGIISTNSEEIKDRITSLRNRDGIFLNPFSSWLCLRGMRTLPLRLKQHSANANTLYAYLEKTFPRLNVTSTGCTSFSKKNGVRADFHSGLLTIDFEKKQ